MTETKYRIIVNLVADIVVVGLGCLFMWYLVCKMPHTAPIQAPDSPVEQRTAPERITKPDISLDKLLDAIEQVESSGDAGAVGDNGKAIGAYQIHEIYVDDVNRIIKASKKAFRPREHYTYDDRWYKYRCRQMIRIYVIYYGQYADTDASWYEIYARIHNGGPNGWKKESTKEYWKKVQKYLEVSR